MNISSKLPRISTSIFTVMSQMANEYQAINLSQGFPNFPVDEKLTSILEQLSRENIHQYAPMAGLPVLLEKIAVLTQKNYNRNLDPSSEILITAGATEGIFASIQALVQADEEVIILDPSYDCYETPIILCKAIPKRINLNNDFTVNWERVGQSITTKTRMIITNNPHNPSGRIWRDEDFIALEKLVDQYPNLIILSDEVYEYITFENKHISIHQRPKLIDRSVIISSFGKSFHITGWKIGYLIAPEIFMREIKKVHQFLVFSVNSVSQYALNKYLETPKVDELGSFYQKKRDFFRDLIKETPFELLPCEGTYFQIASYASFSDENDIDFTKRLVKEYGVAVVPISSFFEDKKDLKLIRFCFAKDDETLIHAAERLVKL